jgi:hypothetical protein
MDKPKPIVKAKAADFLVRLALRERAERAIRGESSWDFSPRSVIALLDEIDRLEKENDR